MIDNNRLHDVWHVPALWKIVKNLLNNTCALDIKKSPSSSNVSDEKWLMMEETLHIPVSPAGSRGHLVACLGAVTDCPPSGTATSLLPPAAIHQASFLLRVSLNVVQDTLVPQIFDRMSLCLLKGFTPSNIHLRYTVNQFALLYFPFLYFLLVAFMSSNIIKKKKTQLKLKLKGQETMNRGTRNAEYSKT